MNRLVIIGNGFDLAHDLKTKYENFIYWYWEQKFVTLRTTHSTIVQDPLCTLENYKSEWFTYLYCNSAEIKDLDGKGLYQYIKKYVHRFAIHNTPFFENIHKSIETKGWVDIENEYYNLLEAYSLKQYDEEKIHQLNEQLKYLQELLTDYLKTINEQDTPVNEGIERRIYEPIKEKDLSVEYRKDFNEYIDWCNKQEERYWIVSLCRYNINPSDAIADVLQYRKDPRGFARYPDAYMLPESIMLLDFNYTKTSREYLKKGSIFSHIHIHGYLEKPDTMIFGYGDEFEDKYKKLQNLNNNDCLTNIKTIRYQESDNYRRALSFIESGPFQVCIMGHSCGNSDRTLLNTIFEHKNCISIKPYFRRISENEDNYIELIQNISRNFTDMKLMRDRVVNKTYCEPLVPRTK